MLPRILYNKIAAELFIPCYDSKHRKFTNIVINENGAGAYHTARKNGTTLAVLDSKPRLSWHPIVIDT